MTPLVFRLVYYNVSEGSKSLGKCRLTGSLIPFLSAFMSPLWMKSVSKLIVLSCVVGSCCSEENKVCLVVVDTAAPTIMQLGNAWLHLK